VRSRSTFVAIVVATVLVVFNIWQVSLERASQVHGSEERIFQRRLGSVLIGVLLFAASTMWRAAARSTSKTVASVLRGLVWGSLLIAGLATIGLVMSMQF